MPPLNGQDGNGSGTILSTTFGVWGDSDSGDGLIGTSSSNNGVFGQSAIGIGVHGSAYGRASGVLGENANGGNGVTGISTAGRVNAAGQGVRGVSGTDSGILPPVGAVGVWGDTELGLGVSGTSYSKEGVYGVTRSSTHAAVAGINKSKANNEGSNPGHGVYGETQSRSFEAAGVYGKSMIGSGVHGSADLGGDGVYGESSGGGDIQSPGTT